MSKTSPGSKPPEDRRPLDICGRKPTGSTLKTKTPGPKWSRAFSFRERADSLFFNKREGGNYFRLTVEHGGEATKDGADRTCEERAVKRRTIKSRPAGWCPSVGPTESVFRPATECRRRILPVRKRSYPPLRTSSVSPLSRFNILVGSPGGGF